MGGEGVSPPHTQVLTASASAQVTSTFLGTPVRFDPVWFLNRSAWFGQNRDGNLTLSQLHALSYLSRPTHLQVSELNASVLKALSLGPVMGTEACDHHEEGCVFIGDSDATFTPSVVVA